MAGLILQLLGWHSDRLWWWAPIIVLTIGAVGFWVDIWAVDDPDHLLFICHRDGTVVQRGMTIGEEFRYELA